MIPETSQTASADASASRPALEDANTCCTVWSMPLNTSGRTFGWICGPIVFFQSCRSPPAPRMPSPKSVHATAAMKERNAIALAYVRRLWRSKRSTQSRTICLKLRQRDCTGGAAFPRLTTRKRGRAALLAERVAQTLLGEIRRVEHVARRRCRDRDAGPVVVEVHRHGHLHLLP